MTSPFQAKAEECHIVITDDGSWCKEHGKDKHLIAICKTSFDARLAEAERRGAERVVKAIEANKPSPHRCSPYPDTCCYCGSNDQWEKDLEVAQSFLDPSEPV